jgi:hypothetical protein
MRRAKRTIGRAVFAFKEETERQDSQLIWMV